MTLNKTEANDLLKILNLPDSINRIAAGEDMLEMELRPPYYIYSNGSPSFPENYVPLFEMGTNIFFFDMERSMFIRVNLECHESINTIGKSVDCLLAYFFIMLWDWELSEEKLRSYAEKVNFTKLPQMLSQIEIENAKGWNEYEIWQHAFIQSCEENNAV